MVQHWCLTPASPYLGSSYGHSFKKSLQQPLSSAEAFGQLNKLTQDIPYLAAIGTVSYTTRTEGNDKLIHIIAVSGSAVGERIFDIGGF